MTEPGSPQSAHAAPEGPLPETAATIAERAAELFAARGFSKTSIREIAEAAGVTKPTVYYYFGSKEGLIRHILEWASRVFYDALAASPPDATLPQALYVLTERQLAFADRHPAIVALMARLDLQAPEEVTDFDLDAERVRSHLALRALFEAAAARGEIGDANLDLLTLNFTGALIVHLMGRIMRPDLFTSAPAEAAAGLVHLFLDGALPRPPGTPRSPPDLAPASQELPDD